MNVDELLELIAPLRHAFKTRGRRLYLVGGIVRDLLLDLADEAPDIDLTTDALPNEILDIVRPLADYVWTQGVRFGTVGCRLGAHRFELTTHRSESYVSDSRKPVVAFSDRIDDDLSRRDFTINAMAIDVETQALVDPFDGQGDLAGRRLRTPLAPEVSFNDDPLRMLRAARFSARFGLDVIAEVRGAMSALSPRLAIVSHERIHDEFERLLAIDRPAGGLQLLHDTGVLVRFVPMWSAVERARARELFDETNRARAALVRRALLLADFSDESIAGWLRSLRYSHDDERSTRRVCRMLGEIAALDSIDDRTARRLARAAGEDLDASIDASRVRRLPQAVCLGERVAELRAAGELDDLGPELDGMAVQTLLGIGPGREVGRALAFLQTLRLNEGRLGEAEAAARLHAWWREPPSEL